MRWRSGEAAKRPEHAWPLGHVRGRSTIEWVFLVASVVAALTAMGVYLQRGYQNYLRNTSQAHGVQFDPTSTFAESRTMHAYLRNQAVDVTSAEASVPGINGTTLPARTLTTKVETVTAWDVSRDANYDAR